MKRKLIILLALAVVACTSGIAIAAGDTAATNAAESLFVLEENGNALYTVAATGLNLRQGPSTDYGVVRVLKQGASVQVIGRIGNWAAVYDPVNGYFGAVDSKYLEASVVTQPAAAASATPVDISADEQALLDLVNKARVEAGVTTLSFDKTLLETARLKAQDMAENNYFSHQSPTYGSPFDMMRSYDLEFKAAGENIAGNETVEGAFEAWMSSDGHKKNILNNNFNYVGIGVATSKTYGKILVQQFIGK